MSARDPNVPQLDFPQLVADIISELRLTGQVGLLDFSDIVTPVYIVAARGGSLDVVASAPVFASASIFAAGAISPAAGTVIVDTGPLPAGGYDIFSNISIDATSTVAGAILLQHRNAANTVTLATLLQVSVKGGAGPLDTRGISRIPLIGYTLALNERLRVTITVAIVGPITAEIFALIRPTP